MKQRFSPLKWLLAPACMALASLHYIASRRVPVGVFNDDAFFIILAKSLRSGAFCLRDGTPVTDPLPGFSALLMLPAWAVEPRWHLLQVLVVACGILAVVLTWRLALGFMPRPWALAAALLTGLNPVLVGLGGIVIPDIPYLALSLGLFLGAGAIRPSSPWWSLPLLTAGAAMAGLTRPQGALLVLGLGVAVWVRLGRGRGLAFMAGALAPLAAWLCRNFLAGRTVTGFVSNWKSQFFLFPGPIDQARHFIELVASLFGQGLVGAPGPLALSAAMGFGCLLLAGHGAVRLTKSPGNGPAAGMASYIILVLALHATWPLTEARYLIPLLPFAVILILASLRTWLDRLAPAALLLLAVQSLVLLSYDLAFAVRGWGPRPLFEPETMEWLRRNTPKEARIESLAFHAVELFADRKASPPGLTVYDRDAWMASVLARGVTHLHVSNELTAGEFSYPSLPYLKPPSLESWARATSYAAQAYANPEEGTTVFAVSHPDPRRYFKAYSACFDSQDPASVVPAKVLRSRLKEALELEPGLECAARALGRGSR